MAWPARAAAALMILLTSISAAQETPPPLSAEIVDFYDGLRAWDLDEKEIAASIWLRAAELGDRRAMMRLADLFESGDHIPQDSAVAYFWLSLAAKGSTSPPVDDLARLRGKLHGDQVRLIDSAVGEWQPLRVADATVSAWQTAAVADQRELGVADLLAALDASDLKAFKAALDGDVSANVVAPDGTPVLFLAVATRRVEFVKSLLEKGANANVALANGLTPLHVAAGIGDVVVARLLLSGGAEAAIQDANGAWSDELARSKGYTEIADLLSSARDASLATAKDYLEKRGYIKTDLSDVWSRDDAVRMYQQSWWAIDITGHFDATTLSALQADAEANKPIRYHSVIRYEKDDQFWYFTSSERFRSAAEARAAAIKLCEDKGGHRCKFNFAPAGGCIAVAAADVGEFRVSAAFPDKASAESHAHAQCREEHSQGCLIEHSACAGRS